MGSQRCTVDRLDKPSAYFNSRVSVRLADFGRLYQVDIFCTDAMSRMHRTNAGETAETAGTMTRMLICSRSSNQRMIL